MKRLTKILMVLSIGVTSLFSNEIEISDKKVETLLKQTISLNKKDKEFVEIRKKSMEKVIEGQELMRKKYPAPITEFRGSTESQIKASRARQSKKIAYRAKSYINNEYKFLDKDRCSRIKDSQIDRKAICEYKSNNYQKAMDMLSKSVLKNDNKYSFCTRAIMRLTQAETDASVISKTNKEMSTYLKSYSEKQSVKELSGICKKAFRIGIQG